MAKKGAAVQLQAELNNDEEFERFLGKDGLLLIDVYSDWCGPCTGMTANLKKLKLEYGGDMLQLAIAKSDNITALERFRDKSEPTWMFISKGKMIKLLFGADSPKLSRTIIDELKTENLVQKGEKQRTNMSEITDLTEDEQIKYDEAQAVIKAKQEKEARKRAKEIHDRRVEECKNILINVDNYGSVLVFPNAKLKYREIIQELLDEAGLIINGTEKVNFTKELLDELLYFAGEEPQFTETSMQELLSEESIVVLITPSRGTTIGNMDDTILTLIYGPIKRPPGSPDSPFDRLRQPVEEEFKPSAEGEKKKSLEEKRKSSADSGKTEDKKKGTELEGKKSESGKLDERRKSEKKEDSKKSADLIGLWVPPNSYVRATSLKLFLKRLTHAFHLSAPEPTPPHIAVVFDHHKTREALQIMNNYPNEIMAYGFFTSERAHEAQLIAKNVRKLEKVENRDYAQERLVIKASKKKSECIFAFAQLGPVYMSPNAEEGDNECSIFFPDEYLEEADSDEGEAVLPEEDEPELGGEEQIPEPDDYSYMEGGEGEIEEEGEGEDVVFDDMFSQDPGGFMD